MTTFSPSVPVEQTSVCTLAELAMNQSGAAGYALYALDLHAANKESGALIVQCQAGTSLPRPEDLTISRGVAHLRGLVVISYPLRVERSLIATLAFAFQGDTPSAERTALLDRMARVIETVYCLPHSAARLFDKVNRMEAQLAASKIAARAQGILGAALPIASPHGGFAGIDLIEQQVEQTIRSWGLVPLLQNLLQKAEEKACERELTGRAKALLQGAYGMSEEEAYVHLRSTSRRTRRPLSEVALEVLSENGKIERQHKKRNAG